MLLSIIFHNTPSRNLDFNAAKEMLINTLKWRKEFAADTILDEECDQSVFNETVGYLYETDKDGRPVTYNFYGELDQNTVFGDVDRLVSRVFFSPLFFS